MEKFENLELRESDDLKEKGPKYADGKEFGE